MNIIFNPLDKAALTEDQLKDNDDIIFDLSGNNIFAKGVKFYGKDTLDWDHIINAPNKLPNPESLTIFGVPYNGAKAVTITPNNYIYKVEQAKNISSITDKIAFIGTYYEPSNDVTSANNTPLRYSVNDIWDNLLKPKIDSWYTTQSSKVNATLWGNKFTGTENISNSLYLNGSSKLFIGNTEILSYQNNGQKNYTFRVGYDTFFKENNSTSIYGRDGVILYTWAFKSFEVTPDGVSTSLPIYANNTVNIASGLYLSSHIIGKLNNSTQSYTDPWQDSKADFRFGGSLAATKIYASQGFYHPNYDSTTGDTYLLTANGGTTTVKNIRQAVYVEQDNNRGDSYPLIWTNEANTSNKDSHLYKSYDKLTFNPNTISLTIGSSTTPTSYRLIDGMTKAAVNTYSNGYRAWISGSTSSGRLSIGSFGDSTSDGNIYFSYAAEKDIIAGTNNVISNIWINPKTSIINSTYYSGWSYTASGGYHLLQKNGSSDIVAGLITTDGNYYQTTNTAYYAKRPWGCIPIINRDSGVMEIGKYLDFHNDNNERDYSTRLYTDGNYGNDVLMPKKNGRLLVESDLDNIKNMYEVVVNLHPSNYVLNDNNEYVSGYSYSEDTWYPIEIQLHTVRDCGYPVIRGEILQYLDCGYTNSKGTRVVTGSGNCKWMTHQNGFSTRIVFESQASGWGTTPNNILRIMDANQTWCVVNPVRNMVQDYESSSIVVWCRGYGEYRFRFNYPNVGVVVHNSSFSLGDPGNSNVYKTYTFSSIINNTTDPSWNKIWNDLNSKLPEIKPTLGYWADVAVSNISNKNTSPTFYTVWAQNMFRSIGQTGWYNETFQDGIVMKESKWIETWAGANIYTSGAMSSGKLCVGTNKRSDIEYDLYIFNTNGSKFNGTINTTFGTILTNKPSIDFRGGSGIGKYTSWCHHEASGHEALLFATEDIDTTIMFANGIKQSRISNSLYQTITAPLRIQQNKVWMGYQYQTEPSSSCTLNVNGGTCSSGFHHATYDSDSYVLLAGGGVLPLDSFVGWTSKREYGSEGKYDLSFVKLQNFNNLVYVDGLVKKDASFTVSPIYHPYIYSDDYNMVTYHRLSGNDYIQINGNGYVTIVANQSYRIGFFYTGRA